MTIPGTPGMALPLLVGREREQVMLRDHLAAVFAEHGSLVLIGGEAGIGKTALADALCDTATMQGTLVLVGRCYDLTETPPYGPWVELFGHYQPTDDDSPLPAAFAQRGTVGEVTSQAMLFQQVQDFLTALARQQPLVLLLDDLHWADPASLDLLRSLARSVAALPLLIIVTYRSDELTRRHPLYALLPTLVRESHTERLDLRPLTENDLRELLGLRYGLGPADTSRLIAYLHERAEGNPFFLGELLRTLEEEGALRATDDGGMLGDLTRVRVPPLLRQVIDGRLARLGEEAQTLLGIAAVIGQDVPLTLWSAVTGEDDEALLPIIERAVEAHLLTETPDGTQVRFVHALIREALYEGILATRRRGIHRRVADAVMTRPNSDPDVVAYHFRRAGDMRAAEWLIAAGERAQRVYAWQTAIERFEAALATMELSDQTAALRGWLLYRLAIVCRYDNLPKAIAYEDEAARLAEIAVDRSLAAAALFSRGWLRMLDGEFTEAAILLASGNEALEALSAAELDRIKRADDLGSNMFAETGRGELMEFFASAGRYAEVRALHDRYFATVPTSKSTKAWAAATIGGVSTSLGKMHAVLGQPAKAREAFQRARTAFRATSHQVMLAWTATYELEMVMLPYYADRLIEREQVAAEVEHAWQRLGDIGYITNGAS